MPEKKYKVYKYTFPNGKIYIGTTSLTLEQRKDCGYGHNLPLREAIRRYKWNGFEKEILYDGLSQNEAFEMEKKTIKELNAQDKKCGYNISFGGKSTFAGLSHTKEAKEKLSRDRKGIPKSELAKSHMRLSHKKERKAVYMLDENGNIMAWFCSLKSAAEFVGGYISNIKRSCDNPTKPYKGAYWKLEKGCEK